MVLLSEDGCNRLRPRLVASSPACLSLPPAPLRLFSPEPEHTPVKPSDPSVKPSGAPSLDQSSVPPALQKLLGLSSAASRLQLLLLSCFPTCFSLVSVLIRLSTCQSHSCRGLELFFSGCNILTRTSQWLLSGSFSLNAPLGEAGSPLSPWTWLHFSAQHSAASGT